jgi:hypothetical protein
VVDAAGPTDSAPQGTRHQRLLQPLWWSLSDPPTAPPGGLPSTYCSTSVVDVVGPTGSTPRGPTIYILQLSGSHSQTSGSTSQRATMSRTFLSKKKFHNLSQGGSRGHCQYLADQVPLHISFKSRQVADRTSTRCHVPYGSGPRLPAEMGCNVVTCPIAPDCSDLMKVP